LTAPFIRRDNAASPFDFFVASDSMRYAFIVPAGLLLGMCLLPQVVFFADHGRLPLYTNTSFLEVGMTQQEVLARLGPPHLRSDDPDGETWYYWNDCLTITGQAIKFNLEGKITNTWI
jgi:outer membrane protein assembly factor BamE (lipoprotein component of BamABCDE complex)